ncbi:hypothetical protein J7Q84_17835 [Bacillus sp. 165]|nr:hypothetical protein [Bacillus sp. 165]
MLTSGTTGLPKGVLLIHEQITEHDLKEYTSHL